MSAPEPGVTQAEQREAAIRATHAELHAGPCRPDGPSVICVLLARLAALERERDSLAKALRDADLLHLADEQSVRNLERERETLATALRRAPQQFTHATDCGTRDPDATTRPDCTCGVDALLAPPAPAGGQ